MALACAIEAFEFDYAITFSQMPPDLEHFEQFKCIRTIFNGRSIFYFHSHTMQTYKNVKIQLPQSLVV